MVEHKSCERLYLALPGFLCYLFGKQCFNLVGFTLYLKLKT